MSKMSKFLIATALCAVALPSVAMADVNGSSSGAFSSLTSCDSSCGINGSGTVLHWGTGQQGASTLTADAVTIGPLTGTTNNVTIGELTWFNAPNTQDQAINSFNVNYTLTVHFTTPNNVTDTQTFNLVITNPTNPPGDLAAGFTMPDLSALTASFTGDLSGWTISGLQYVATGSSGLGGSANCPNNTPSSTWCNPESATNNLLIKANFTQTAVPEPLTLSLFGAGLAGAAAIRRKKKA
jgi:hypothetical protein